MNLIWTSMSFMYSHLFFLKMLSFMCRSSHSFSSIILSSLFSAYCPQLTSALVCLPSSFLHTSWPWKRSPPHHVTSWWKRLKAAVHWEHEYPVTLWLHFATLICFLPLSLLFILRITSSQNTLDVKRPNRSNYLILVCSSYFSWKKIVRLRWNLFPEQKRGSQVL